MGGDSRRERGPGRGRPQRTQQQSPQQRQSTQGATQLFFAAWPAPEIQEALGGVAQRVQSECGGHATPVHNIHLTLVFLGPVPHDRMTELETLAEKVSGQRFDLAVDRLDYWKHNRIAWAGVEQCPEALRALVGQLEKTLGAAGFRLDPRPYVPHITLLREARAPAQNQMPPIAWPVEEFVLVESVQLDQSRVYEVLHHWPLGES